MSTQHHQTLLGIFFLAGCLASCQQNEMSGINGADSGAPLGENPDLAISKVQAPAGSGAVAYTHVSVPQADGKVHMGDLITMTFHVAATATVNGSYLIDAGNDKGWLTTVVGTNPFPLAATLSGLESTHDIFVQVTVPPGTADNTLTLLTVTAKELTPGSNVPFVSPSVTMISGAKPQDADSGVTLGVGGVFHGRFSATSATKLLFYKTINSPPQANNVGNANFDLKLGKTGTYKIEFAFASAAWHVGILSGGEPPPITYVPITIVTGAQMTWDANASDTTLTVTIKQQGTAVAAYTIPVGLI